MRRVAAPVLMMILLLSACGSGPDCRERVEEFRKELSAAGQMSFTGDFCADLGDREFNCVLSCTAAGEELVLEVLEPELIAGITARMSDAENTLIYDDIELSLGTFDGETGPISGAAALMRSLSGGFLSQCWTESGDRELVAAQIYLEENVDAEIRFDSASMLPVYGELVIDGRSVLKCSISDFRSG